MKETQNELELHEQLAKQVIKVHNLHLALEKTRTKVKNQAEQISLLLKQKEELKNELHTLQNDNLEYIDSSVDFYVKYERKIEDLESKLKEKDTIISYLESKLK